MKKKILVTYASKYGSTAEIAEKIGAVLCQQGLQADVFPVNGLRDLKPYQAVILGSAIYIGKWPKAAVTFLQVNEKSLMGMPVWLFSSGPTGEGDPVELVEGQRLPAALQPLVERIKPCGLAVFHGNIDPHRVNFLEKWAIQNVVKKPMGDFRDWEMITGWSNSVADALKNTVLSY